MPHGVRSAEASASLCTSPQPPIDPSYITSIREYLSAIYPTSVGDAVSNHEVLDFFARRQWFYTGKRAPQLPPALLAQLSLIESAQYKCDDGFFGAGLMQRDAPSRFRDVLPCIPGTGCVRRQSGHLPECRGSVAERSEDLWVEVWHLSFDGRSRPRQKPRGWSDFLDHGLAGWWYIHAPGSGIFYHAGRTIAAPSKASMLAALLEEWHAKMGNSSSSKANGDGSGGRRLGRGRSNKRERAAEDADVEARRLINRFTMDNPLQFAQTFRKLEAGVPCKNVSWGRWRCVGDFIPSDTFDPLLLTLGRALNYDSLLLTALMWGRVLGSQQRLLAIAQGRPPPDEPPPQIIYDGEITSELVDLRKPPSPYDTSLLLMNDLANGNGEKREAYAHAWANEILSSNPPRLSVRDPFALADESRARPCNFNYTGGPTVRLACGGHISWTVKDETQHQQTCSRQQAAAAAVPTTKARGGSGADGLLTQRESWR